MLLERLALPANRRLGAMANACSERELALRGGPKGAGGATSGRVGLWDSLSGARSTNRLRRRTLFVCMSAKRLANELAPRFILFKAGERASLVELLQHAQEHAG